MEHKKQSSEYITMHEYLDGRDDPLVIVKIFNCEGRRLALKEFPWIEYGGRDSENLWEAADAYVRPYLEKGAVISSSNRETV